MSSTTRKIGYTDRQHTQWGKQAMPKRHEYRLDLDHYRVTTPAIQLPDAILRAATIADSEALAELMIDAYTGTTDYDDETLDDARAEMERYFSGAYGPPMLDCSWVIEVDDQVIAACLASFWVDQPLISYVMTRANLKGHGLAAALLTATLNSLYGEAHSGVTAVISEGNTPSERLHQRAGFTRITQQQSVLEYA